MDGSAEISPRPDRSFAGRWVLLFCLLAVLSAGCKADYLAMRKRPTNPLADQLSFFSRSGPRPTERTVQLLRRYDLHEKVDKQPQVVLAKLQTVISEEPTSEELYAFAELAYVNGRRAENAKDLQKALALYGSAVGHAYAYLFDPTYDRFRNPYDPQFRTACDVYNGALEAALRIVKKRGKLQPGRREVIELDGQEIEIDVVVRGNWHEDDIANLEFVSDYEVKGLVNSYRSFGLGVPLIAVRQPHEAEDPAEQFYPPGLSFPVTAFLKVDAAQEGHFVLELYDPIDSTDITVAGRKVPLETDLSTPLAYFLNDPALDQTKIAAWGLIRPDDSRTIQGLYMLEPYDPRKIPVVMVHGLFSSPLTWMEMFNDLRSFPELRDNYQFWFYLYPTGQPFWFSARDMRKHLQEVRQALDPQRHSPALDQMVLVGHSMGGLVSKLQTIESGDDFWKLLSDKPFSELKSDEATKKLLEETLFFHPNPAVKRLVTIGSPHRGSNFANETTRWLSRSLITLPAAMVMGKQQIVKDNPGFFKDTGVLEISTSIDSMVPGTPIFQVILDAQKGPGVTYHNIVGVVPEDGWVGRVSATGDGVVSFKSAHLDDVASEIQVTADHVSVHAHPDAVLEVRRILREHLQSARGQVAREQHDTTRASYEQGNYSPYGPLPRTSAADSYPPPWGQTP